MAGKTVSFNTHCNLYESQLESISRWLSCNGEVWGMGPTAVFASAAALFLYNELQATVFIAGDHAHVSLLEKTLVSSMVLGMLALMIHLWVCSMRFFQYYLDTLIKDSPSVLLEMTTAGLLGQTEMVPLGPLTRFLKQQQPQIHITVCWFLSLCYADYVRKHYCQRFNMPYLEQWQSELHERAARGVHSTMEKVNSFVGAVHQRLRGYSATPLTSDAHTESYSERLQVGCGAAAGAPGEAPRVRLVGLSSDTTVDAIAKLRTYIAIFNRAKCGEGGLSAIPTLLWTAGSAALAHCLVSALFRRFMFRRVPLWEIILQYLLFLWMVIYSIHFWVITVNFLKFTIEYCYEPEEGMMSAEEIESRYFIQQWAAWLWSLVPAAVFAHARADRTSPPLMIWITRSPWQRREMGAYGYYLNRPISSLQTPTESARLRALTLRKAFSDSRTIIKEPTRKRRNSKSI